MRAVANAQGRYVELARNIVAQNRLRLLAGSKGDAARLKPYRKDCDCCASVWRPITKKMIQFDNNALTRVHAVNT